MAKKDLPQNSRHDRAPAKHMTPPPARVGSHFEVARDIAAKERAHLVGVVWGIESREAARRSLVELAALARTAGADVVGETLQALRRPDVATFVGKGKVAEIGHACAAAGANVIVFDHDLSPGQARNVQEATKVKVIDRSELILDIFSRRAQTSVARAQVELAQLEYQLPRLKNLWEHLSRLGGGIGTRGPGETQLEVDRRRVRERIGRLRETLKKVERVRAVQRKGRKGAVSVALVGYTNAGKSTLMNRLSGADVFIEDQLFATLDTTTRTVHLGREYTILLTDTVGFIRKLPHQLIASFHATLEEVVTADLLLVVVDGADEDHLAQIETVNDVLDEIGAGQSRRLLVVNKRDRVRDEEAALQLVRLHGPGVIVSARDGEGLADLERALIEFLRESRPLVVADLPLSAARDLAELHARAEVVETEFSADNVRVTFRARDEEVEWLRGRGHRILTARDKINQPEEKAR